MQDAFAYHQVVTDAHGRVVDYIFLDVNPAFEKITGLQKEKIVGKTARQVLPGIENEDFDWIGTYGDVAQSGKPIRFQEYSRVLGCYFDVSAYSDTTGFFMAIFHESDPQSERNNIASLKEAEKRLQFQLEFEKIVFDISSFFVRLPSQDLDRGINYALEAAGKFFQVDRSYVILFSEDEATINLTHEWYREELWPEAPNFVRYPLARRPWWHEQIKYNRQVYIDDVENLPPEAEAEK